MSDYGIIVSGERDKVTSSREPILRSGEKQLKYDKVFDIYVDVPAITTDYIKDVTVNFAEAKLNLTKIPAYQYMVKCGYSNKWGRPSYYEPPSSTELFPYYKIIEEMAVDSFHLQFGIKNSGGFITVPQHLMIIRLIITFDKLEVV